MSKRGGPHYRVSRETLTPLLLDTSVSSREIADQFRYSRHWITQLRGRLGVKGAPGWGGDHRSAAFKARSDAR